MRAILCNANKPVPNVSEKPFLYHEVGTCMHFLLQWYASHQYIDSFRTAMCLQNNCGD